MALVIAGKVAWLDVDDAAFVDMAWRELTGGDEIAEPLRCIGIILVIVGGNQDLTT